MIFGGETVLYSIEIEYSPVYEFILSFVAFSEKKSYTTLDLGTQWVKERKKEMPSEFHEKLANCKKLFSGFPLILVSHSSVRTPKDFIRWLEALSWSEIYETFLWFKEKTSLTRPQDIIKWQELICDLFRTWYDLYFSKVEEATMLHLVKDVDSINKDIVPEELVQQLSNGIRLDLMTGIRHVRLIPQYHCRPYNMYDVGETQLILCYPCRVETSSDELPNDLLRLTKALADENRLKILKTLVQRPHSFTEIAEKMSIAKSTVHHHLTSLRAAGLVWVFLSPNRNERFSLREDVINGMPEQLWRYLKEVSH